MPSTGNVQPPRLRSCGTPAVARAGSTLTRPRTGEGRRGGGRECVELVREVGEVSDIVLTTHAYEHKLFVAPFARNFPRAKARPPPRRSLDGALTEKPTRLACGVVIRGGALGPDLPSIHCQLLAGRLKGQSRNLHQ